jgi:hypothetical protein
MSEMNHVPSLFVVLFALLTATACDSNATGTNPVMTLAWNASGPVHLGAAIVRVPLANTPALRATPPGHKVVLVLSGLSAASQPGITYRVYFGVPEGKAPDEAHLVGTINFYEAVQLIGGKPKPEPSLEFDVTALARDLNAPSVTLVPDGKSELNSAPQIKGIAIVER